MPRPRWGQVRQFCQVQGYVETRTTHFYYNKVLPNRALSRTMVSFGVDGEQVPPQMWRQVWHEQLRLASEDEFWQGLDGAPATYAIPPQPPQAAPLPTYLVRHLRDVLHYTPDRIAATTPEEAQALLDAYYARELGELPDD